MASASPKLAPLLRFLADKTVGQNVASTITLGGILYKLHMDQRLKDLEVRFQLVVQRMYCPRAVFDEELNLHEFPPVVLGD